MFMDCYLHLGQTGIVLTARADEKLKYLVAAVSLYAATRPRVETLAWTLHLDDERMNIFTVAENPTGRVTGQVFAENVKEMGMNVLHAEIAGPGGARRRSSVEFDGSDILRAAESYFVRSEQRPARFFELGGDEFAVVAAQPDCDLQWLAAVDAAAVRALVVGDGRAPLETRCYRFDCGCSPDRIARAIWPAVRGDLAGLFGPESHISVSCPRCGLRHEISRAQFEDRGNV